MYRQIIMAFLTWIISTCALGASEQDKLDSLVSSDSSRTILNPNWVKHNHFVEFSAFIGFISYQPTAGALGYKYLYSTNWDYNIKFGVRAGIWGGQTGDDIPDNSARNFITHSTFLVSSFPIWKSLNIELSTGVASSFSWPTKTNTQDQDNLYSGVTYYNQKLGFDIILFEHLNLDIGGMFLFNSLSKKWNSGTYLSIGYKF